MLRREPTKITLTMEDIAAYDTRKAQRDEQRREQERVTSQAQVLPTEQQAFGSGNAKETRTREQRIGISSSRG